MEEALSALCHLIPPRSAFSKLPADTSSSGWPGARGVQHVGQRPARPVRAAVWALSPRHPQGQEKGLGLQKGRESSVSDALLAAFRRKRRSIKVTPKLPPGFWEVGPNSLKI